MKLKEICSSLIACLIISPVYANNIHHVTSKSDNDCLRHVDNLVMGDTFLFLGQCNIQDRDIPDLIAYLATVYDFEYIDLAGNNIGPDGAKKLASLSSLHNLFLDSNHIGDEGAIAFAKNTSLSTLYVDNNYIGEKGGIALAKNTTLQSLSIAYNDIGNKAIIALAKSKSLYGLSIAGSMLDAAAVSALSKNKILAGLDVSYTGISYSDVLALSSLPDLKEFAVEGLHLVDNGVIALTQKTNIEFLDVANNGISLNGATVLAQAPQLQLVNVNRNNIGDAGIKPFANTNKQFLYLEASEAEITDDGAVALANSKTMLCELDLQYNHIGRIGIDALLSSNTAFLANVEFNDGEGALKTRQMNADINKISMNNQSVLTAIKRYCSQKYALSCNKLIKRIARDKSKVN